MLQNDSGVQFRRALWRAPPGDPADTCVARVVLAGVPKPLPTWTQSHTRDRGQLASSPVAGAVLFLLPRFHTSFRETPRNLPLGPQHGAPDLV